MRVVRAFPIFVLLACGVAACQSVRGPVAVASPTAFDANEAAFIRTQGKAKIDGHAFWRDGDGGVMNAAGEIIRLVPATAYAKERFAAFYRGGHSISAAALPQVETDPGYADYTRTTRAESNGRFTFDHVAPGTYFVTAQIVWRDKRQFLKFQVGIYTNIQHVGQDGGAMYETVTVTGKETESIKLVLTNDK